DRRRKPGEPRGAPDMAGYLPGNDNDDELEADETPAEAPRIEQAAIEWDSGGRETEGKVGAEVIQALVKRLPNAPGVYRMMNAAGDVLYVGKARSLKKRVTNYAQGRGHSNRITRMVRETAAMEFVVTRTETEALLL